MTGCGTTTFTDPGDFQVNLPSLAIDLVLTTSERFEARLTWLRMAELCVMEVEERAPRIAFLSVPEGTILASFPKAALRPSAADWRCGPDSWPCMAPATPSISESQEPLAGAWPGCPDRPCWPMAALCWPQIWSCRRRRWCRRLPQTP